MISVRPAVREDILKVVVDLSDASVLDIKALKLGPEETLGFFAARVPEEDAVAFVKDGEPIAIFGWDKAPGRWYSWLLTTPRMLTRDPAPVFAARDHLRAVAAKAPCVELMSLVTSNTRPVRRWMACLGFRRVLSEGARVWCLAG